MTGGGLKEMGSECAPGLAASRWDTLCSAFRNTAMATWDLNRVKSEIRNIKCGLQIERGLFRYFITLYQLLRLCNISIVNTQVSVVFRKRNQLLQWVNLTTFPQLLTSRCVVPNGRRMSKEVVVNFKDSVRGSFWEPVGIDCPIIEPKIYRFGNESTKQLITIVTECLVDQPVQLFDQSVNEERYRREKNN